jgi:LPXTG-motif cell wall-anchored protein
MRLSRFAKMFTTAGAAVALATLGAVPAYARLAPTVTPFFPNITIPDSGPGRVETIVLYASESIELNHVVFTIDFHDITDFATMSTKNASMHPECSNPTATTLRCALLFPVRVDPALGILPDIVIAPTASAAEGDEGNIRVTLEADGITAASHEARVRVGAAVDLVGGPPVQRDVAVGESFTHAVQVTNAGDAEVRGVGLFLSGDYAMRPGQTFSNCTYADGLPRTCHFDQVLRPGATYQANIPYVVGADTAAPGGAYSEYQWMTSAEFDDALQSLSAHGAEWIGQPGTGGVLALTERASLRAAAIDADVDPTDNWTSLELTVTGTNGTDLAAVGATATGAVGDQVTVEVGLKNNGPAAVDRSRMGSSVALVHVTIPPGTTAVTVPPNCVPESTDGHGDWEHAGRPGQPLYMCSDGMLLPAGDSQIFKITLRIDTVIPDAPGKVSILQACECDDYPASADLDNSNNIASILINPAQGHAAELPKTGAPTATIAAVGILLVLLGTGTVVYVMRRRRQAA